jgi:hypothetical protein
VAAGRLTTPIVLTTPIDNTFWRRHFRPPARGITRTFPLPQSAGNRAFEVYLRGTIHSN